MTTSHVFRAFIISYAVAHASAFQPDFLARAIQEAAQSVSGGANLDPSALITTAASAAVGAAPTSVDEVLFVAANLLDSSRRVGSKRSNNKLQYPELLSDAPNAIRYDYDGAQPSRTISLSASEREVFDLLIAARNRYCPSTTIRVAGGWVRDKLLQQSNAPCRDIDLVLSDVSGMQFVDMLRQYLHDENHLNMLQTNGGDGDIGGEDATNQKQVKSSKGRKADHLQTASLCINGFDLDFVRLRNEKYGDERIPDKVDVGSIVEDAWRRDLTINALYYNINTNQVEDWTEQGLQDLQLRNIATTRPPLKTLLEDPTRLLRAIRFAAQLSWTVDPRLFRAASDLRVRYALQTKVSRDAIGKGIDACFATRDPSRAIKLLLATNLIDVTFPLGDNVSPQVQISIFLSGLDALCRVQTLASRIFTDENEWDKTRRRHLFYASFLKPLYELSDNVLPSKSNKRKSPFNRLLSEGIKLTKSDIRSIEVVLRGSLGLQNLVAVDNMDASSLTDQERQSLRWLFWQALCPLGHIWREALLLSLSSLPIPLSVAVNQYFRLIDVITDELNLDLDLLDGQYKMEPILTGAQIREQALPAVQGEAFQEVLLAQEEWQVRNEIYRPGGSPRDDGDGSYTFGIAIESQLIDHLRSKFPAYCND